MLSLGKVRRSGVGYYFAAVGPRDSGLVEAEGTWLGSVVETLGLGERAVDEATLRLVLEGVDPTSGEILDQHHSRVQVIAYDAVFAAPKTVSVLHALGPAEVRGEIGRVHAASVATVLGHLESEIALVRRSGPEGRRSLPASGLVGASFVHRTSRAPDPHLHSHVVLANLGRDRSGRWSALDGRALFEHQRVAGALYGSELRRGLAERLGLDFRQRRPGVIDVAGLSDGVIAAFSRRLGEIELERSRSGATGGRAARFASDRTRPEKDLTTSYETLVERWREEAYRLGVADRAFAPTRARPSSAQRDDPALSVAIGAALGSFDRPFLRRELVAAAAARVVAGAATSELEAATDAALVSSAIEANRVGEFPARRWGRVPLVGSPQRYVTSEAGTRWSAIAVARRNAPDLGGFVRVDTAGHAAVDEQPNGVVAGPRQNPLITLEMLRALGEDAAQRGRRVLGVAAHRGLAAHLEGLTGIASSGIDELSLPRHGELVIVFGAGLLAPRSQAALIERAETTGSAVVLVDVGRRGDAGVQRGATTPVRTVAQDPALIGQAPRGRSAIEATVAADGMRSLFAPRLSDLGDVLDAACSAVRDAGRRPVIVLADRALGEDLGVDSVAPGAALRLERTEDDVGLVVVGGRAVLPESRPSLREHGQRSVVALACAPERAFDHLDVARVPTRERSRSFEGRTAGLGIG